MGWVARHPNLVVLRTFSKCAALAGLRCARIMPSSCPAWVAAVLAPHRPAPSFCRNGVMAAPATDPLLPTLLPALVPARPLLQSGVRRLPSGPDRVPVAGQAAL